MYSNRIFPLLALIFYITTIICASSTIYAQETTNPKKSITIDPVIVLDSPINNNVDLKKNTTTISEEELNTIDASTLDSVLEEQAGIYSFSTIHGKDIQLRGLNSAYIQFNIDGMPLIGRTAGIFDTEKISVRNFIQKIEIIKGPSLEYGNQAIAGIINIVTKPIDSGFYFFSNIKASSFNTYDLNINTNYRKKYNGLALFVNRYSTSGYGIRQQDNSVLQTTFPLYNYATGIKYNFNNKKFDFTLNTIYNYEHQFVSQSPISKLAKDNNLITRINISPELNYSINDKARIKLKSYLTTFNNGTESIEKQTNKLLAKSFFNESLYKINTLYDFTIDKNLAFKLGLENYYETLKASRYDNSVSRNTTRSFLIFSIKNLFLKKLEILPGISYDLVSTPATNFSPSLNINYDLSKSLSANFSIIKGFSLPDFRQLYMNFNNGNVGYLVLGSEEIISFIKQLEQNGNLNQLLIDLNNIKYLTPEYSWNYTVGLTKKFSNIVISASYFINTVHNLIEAIPIATKKDGMLIYSYKNLNNIHIDGLDLNTNIYLTPKIQAGIGFQYLNAYDIALRKRANEEHKKDGGLLNRSKYAGTVKFSYMITNYLEASLRGLWRTRYGYIDKNADGYLNDDSEYLPGYFILNTGISAYLIQKQIKVNFSINNINNYTNQYLTNLPGRTFNISIIYNYYHK